jgi:hypothetical protein
MVYSSQLLCDYFYVGTISMWSLTGEAQAFFSSLRQASIFPEKSSGPVIRTLLRRANKVAAGFSVSSPWIQQDHSYLYGDAPVEAI